MTDLDALEAQIPTAKAIVGVDGRKSTVRRLRFDDALCVDKSVSQMVADYFRFLDAQPAPTASPDAAMGNKTQALKGLLKKANINEDDYNQYRTDKYL